MCVWARTRVCVCVCVCERESVQKSVPILDTFSSYKSHLIGNILGKNRERKKFDVAVSHYIKRQLL